MFKIFKISGDSLYPYYKNGQRVICSKIFTKTKIGLEDTVVFTKENYGYMIKNVKRIKKDKRYFVEGTNPYSIDSRDFGLLSHSELKYKVLFTF